MAKPEEKEKSMKPTRGHTRPMMDSKPADHEKMGPAYSQNRRKMAKEHHSKTLWVYWTLIMLGVWMLAAPLTFSYANALSIPPGGRTLWLGLEERRWAMTVSDLVSGLLLVITGFRALKPNRPINLWIACFVGIWMNAAPLIFWSPSSAGYMNNTLVGTLVIALTVLIAGMPNMVMFMAMGDTVPKGWSYNPSSWPQRWIMIALGFAGWLVSRYLAAYQMGYMPTVFEPFFGDGTVKVLTSDLSKALPVSDAGLGAFAYTFEFLMGFMGGPARWRTMPWMVTFFGILVIPLGLVQVFLVLSQPLTVGAWCSGCLLSALIMLPMIPLETDEVIAMGQFLRRSKAKGENLGRVFWKGGEDKGGGPDDRSPGLDSFADHSLQVVKASVWGCGFPWSLAALSITGLLLASLGQIFALEGMTRNIMQGTGLLILTFALLSVGEVIRSLRLCCVPLGLLVAASPLFLDQSLMLSLINGALGLVAIGLSLPKGPIRESYENWQNLIV